MLFKRILAAGPTLFLITLLSFALMRALPGDPVEIMLGSAQKELPAQDLALLRSEFGLDQSAVKQYFYWLSGWFKGPDESTAAASDSQSGGTNGGSLGRSLGRSIGAAGSHSSFIAANALGRSYRDGRPVREVILERVPATLTLIGLALFTAFILGPALGAILAVLALISSRQGASKENHSDLKIDFCSKLESIITGALLALYSAPNFWLAFIMLAAIQCGFVNLSVLGVHGPGEKFNPAQALTHLAAPALILASRRTAKVALFIRTMALEELGREYVITALAKGLSYDQVVFGHVLKNCLIPVVNLLGLSLPALIGGSVLIETIFCVPGLGRLSVEATFGRNYPVLMGLVTLYGTTVIFANLASDLAARLVDPRLAET